MHFAKVDTNLPPSGTQEDNQTSSPLCPVKKGRPCAPETCRKPTRSISEPISSMKKVNQVSALPSDKQQTEKTTPPICPIKKDRLCSLETCKKTLKKSTDVKPGVQKNSTVDSPDLHPEEIKNQTFTQEVISEQQSIARSITNSTSGKQENLEKKSVHLIIEGEDQNVIVEPEKDHDQPSKEISIPRIDSVTVIGTQDSLEILKAVVRTPNSERSLITEPSQKSTCICETKMFVDEFMNLKKENKMLREGDEIIRLKNELDEKLKRILELNEENRTLNDMVNALKSNQDNMRPIDEPSDSEPMSSDSEYYRPTSAKRGDICGHKCSDIEESQEFNQIAKRICVCRESTATRNMKSEKDRYLLIDVYKLEDKGRFTSDSTSTVCNEEICPYVEDDYAPLSNFFRARGGNDNIMQNAAEPFPNYTKLIDECTDYNCPNRDVTTDTSEKDAVAPICVEDNISKCSNISCQTECNENIGDFSPVLKSTADNGLSVTAADIDNSICYDLTCPNKNDFAISTSQERTVEERYDANIDDTSQMPEISKEEKFDKDGGTVLTDGSPFPVSCDLDTCLVTECPEQVDDQSPITNKPYKTPVTSNIESKVSTSIIISTTDDHSHTGLTPNVSNSRDQSTNVIGRDKDASVILPEDEEKLISATELNSPTIDILKEENHEAGVDVEPPATDANTLAQVLPPSSEPASVKQHISTTSSAYGSDLPTEEEMKTEPLTEEPKDVVEEIPTESTKSADKITPASEALSPEAMSPKEQSYADQKKPSTADKSCQEPCICTPDEETTIDASKNEVKLDQPTGEEAVPQPQPIQDSVSDRPETATSEKLPIAMSEGKEPSTTVNEEPSQIADGEPSKKVSDMPIIEESGEPSSKISEKEEPKIIVDELHPTADTSGVDTTTVSSEIPSKTMGDEKVPSNIIKELILTTENEVPETISSEKPPSKIPTAADDETPAEKDKEPSEIPTAADDETPAEKDKESSNIPTAADDETPAKEDKEPSTIPAATDDETPAEKDKESSNIPTAAHDETLAKEEKEPSRILTAADDETPAEKDKESSNIPTAADDETPAKEHKEPSKIPTAADDETPAEKDKESSNIPFAAVDETPAEKDKESSNIPTAADGESPAKEHKEPSKIPTAADDETPAEKDKESSNIPTAADDETPAKEDKEPSKISTAADDETPAEEDKEPSKTPTAADDETPAEKDKESSNIPTAADDETPAEEYKEPSKIVSEKPSTLSEKEPTAEVSEKPPTSIDDVPATLVPTDEPSKQIPAKSSDIPDQPECENEICDDKHPGKEQPECPPSSEPNDKSDRVIIRCICKSKFCKIVPDPENPNQKLCVDVSETHLQPDDESICVCAPSCPKKDEYSQHSNPNISEEKKEGRSATDTPYESDYPVDGTTQASLNPKTVPVFTVNPLQEIQKCYSTNKSSFSNMGHFHSHSLKSLSKEQEYAGLSRKESDSLRKTQYIPPRKSASSYGIREDATDTDDFKDVDETKNADLKIVIADLKNKLLDAEDKIEELKNIKTFGSKDNNMALILRYSEEIDDLKKSLKWSSKEKEEYEYLKQKVKLLEQGRGDTENITSNLQTAVDLYVNTIQLLERSEQKLKFEVDQHKINNEVLGEFLLSLSHEMDDLTQKFHRDMEEQIWLNFVLYMESIDIQHSNTIHEQQVEEAQQLELQLMDHNYDLEMEHVNTLQDLSMLETQIYKYQSISKALEDDKTGMKVQLKKLSKKNKCYEEIVQFFKEEMSVMSDELLTLQEVLNVTNVSSQEENTRLINAILQLRRINDRLVSHLCEIEKQVVLENQINQINETRINELQDIIGSKNNDLNQHDQTIQEMKKKLNNATKQNADLKKTIKNLTDAVVEIQEGIKSVERDHNRNRNDVSVVESKVCLANGNLKDIKVCIEQKNSKIQDLENQLKSQEVSIILATKELEVLKEKKADYKKLIISLKDQLASHEKKNEEMIGNYHLVSNQLQDYANLDHMKNYELNHYKGLVDEMKMSLMQMNHGLESCEASNIHFYEDMKNSAISCENKGNFPIVIKDLKKSMADMKRKLSDAEFKGGLIEEELLKVKESHMSQIHEEVTESQKELETKILASIEDQAKLNLLVEQQKEEIEELKKELERERQESCCCKRSVSELKNEKMVSNAQMEILHLKCELNKSLQRQRLLSEENDKIHSKMISLRKKLSTIEHTYEVMKQENEEYKIQLKKTVREKEYIAHKNQELTKSIEQMRSSHDQLERQCRYTNDCVQNLELELSETQTEKDNISSEAQNLAQVVKMWLHEQNIINGEIRGKFQNYTDTIVSLKQSMMKRMSQEKSWIKKPMQQPFSPRRYTSPPQSDRRSASPARNRKSERHTSDARYRSASPWRCSTGYSRVDSLEEDVLSHDSNQLRNMSYDCNPSPFSSRSPSPRSDYLQGEVEMNNMNLNDWFSPNFKETDTDADEGDDDLFINKLHVLTAQVQEANKRWQQKMNTNSMSTSRAKNS